MHQLHNHHTIIHIFFLRLSIKYQQLNKSHRLEPLNHKLINLKSMIEKKKNKKQNKKQIN